MHTWDLFRFFLLCRNRHDHGFTPEHENRKYDGTPPQGLSEARRAGFFLNCLLLIHRGGDPSGAAVTIVNGGV